MRIAAQRSGVLCVIHGLRFWISSRLLSTPFCNRAGWFTAILGEQPYVVHNNIRRSTSAVGKLSLPYGLPWLMRYGSLNATRWFVTDQA